MPIILLLLISCGKNVGFSTSSTSIKTNLPLLNDEFKINFIPTYLKYGPQENSPNNYLISGSLKTIEGSLSETQITEELNKACKNRCEVLQLTKSNEDSSLWNYQLSLEGKDSYEVVLNSGILSQEGLATKKPSKLLLEYQDFVLPPSVTSELFFSFTPQTVNYLMENNNGKMILPLKIFPENLTVNLAQLNSLEKPTGCEGLIFNEENNMIIAKLPMVSMSQQCSFTIVEKSIQATDSSNTIYKNYNTTFVLSFNGITVQPTLPIVTPESFNILLTPIAIDENKAKINVTSPHALSTSTFINSLVLNGCSDPELISNSGLHSTFSFSVKMTASLCQIMLPSGIFSVNNATNNASLTSVLAIVQNQVVSDPNVVNNNITNTTNNNTVTINNNTQITINPSIPVIICPPVVPTVPVNPVNPPVVVPDTTTPITNNPIITEPPKDDETDNENIPDTEVPVIPVSCNYTPEELYAIKVLLVKFPQLSCTNQALKTVELEARYGNFGQVSESYVPSYFNMGNYTLINSKFTNNFYSPGNLWTEQAILMRNMLKNHLAMNNVTLETTQQFYDLIPGINSGTNALLLQANYYETSKMIPTSSEIALGASYGLSSVDLYTPFPVVVNNFINAELEYLTPLNSYPVQQDSNYTGSSTGTFSPSLLNKSQLKFKIKNSQCPAVIALMSAKIGRTEYGSFPLSNGGISRVKHDRHTLYGGRAFVYIPQGYLNKTNCSNVVSESNLVPINQPYDIEGYSRELNSDEGLTSANLSNLQGPYTQHNAGSLIFKTATY